MIARPTPWYLSPTGRSLCLAIVLGLLLPACGGGGGSGEPVEPAPPPPAPPTACGAGITAAPGLVVTTFGAVQGTQLGNVYAFLGIPYAAPPVGSLRWQAPQDPACWETTRSATAFAPACIQKHFEQGSTTSTTLGSEDCLYLNVWTQQGYGGQSRPVMVFVHGGGNQQGSTGEIQAGAALYDGAKLADRGDVVMVTIAYRLGPLGFLASPALADNNGRYGNWGLLDQIHALNWVQQNIARFGGDPARVMLFGESGGAVDTCMLMTSPLAAGLFSRAAMQSGACVARTLAVREQEASDYLADVGCDSAADQTACLMALDAEAAIDPVAGGTTGGLVAQAFGPTIDGWVLPIDPLLALQQGTYNHVPLIVGSNDDETAAMIPPGTVNRAMLLAFFSAFPEPERSDLLALYDPGSSVPLTTPSAEARAAMIRATSDAQFVCQPRRIARAITQSPGTPSAVYRYVFTHRLNGVLGTTFGAFHGLELFYVFQTFEDSNFAANGTADDTTVAAHMLDYWTRFAATGNPNGTGAFAWPAYANDDPYLEIAPTLASGLGVRTTACDLWDAVIGL